MRAGGTCDLGGADKRERKKNGAKRRSQHGVPRGVVNWTKLAEFVAGGRERRLRQSVPILRESVEMENT